MSRKERIFLIKGYKLQLATLNKRLNHILNNQDITNMLNHKIPDLYSMIGELEIKIIKLRVENIKGIFRD